jgi:hypothetical protein
MTVSPLLQVVAAYLATSFTIGPTLGVALGAMIRRADRRHQQDIALLMRSRIPHDVGSETEQTARGRGDSPRTPACVDDRPRYSSEPSSTSRRLR